MGEEELGDVPQVRARFLGANLGSAKAPFLAGQTVRTYTYASGCR